MSPLDYGVLTVYIAGVLLVGVISSAKIRSSSDMFTAGRQSPWWVAGLSAFMTMFSAATFTVWGGIAYKYGLVAISINLAFGVAALLTGFFVAGKWRALGVSTAAEFLELRFGRIALALYSLLNIVYKLLTVAVSVYALGKIVCALMPLSVGNPLQDVATGNLSVSWAIAILGTVVVLYTVIGGLWAVLITDVLQFIVLMVAVAFVLPMMLMKVGGFGQFVAAAPSGFFSPTSTDWTWAILALWCGIHFLMTGAEWAFAQRYLCVPNQKDARKAAWLFGALYLFSPVLWMLPPMIYRTMNPAADPEQAYILACQAVLPVGMTGLVVAAMISATASMVDSQLNVFAGVLTNDFLRGFFEKIKLNVGLVLTGRIVTLALGVVLISLAVMVPTFGKSEAFLVKVGSLFVGPLLWPTIWGLFSKRITSTAVWVTWGVCFVVFGFIYLLLAGKVPIESLTTVAEWIRNHQRLTDLAIGFFLPIITLTGCELFAKQTSEGWLRVTEREQAAEQAASTSSTFPVRVIAWSLICCALLLAMLLPFNKPHLALIASFAAVLAVIGTAFLISLQTLSKKASQ